MICLCPCSAYQILGSSFFFFYEPSNWKWYLCLVDYFTHPLVSLPSQTYSSHFAPRAIYRCWDDLKWSFEALQRVLSCRAALQLYPWPEDHTVASITAAAGKAAPKRSHLSADPIRTVCCFFLLMSAFNSLQLFSFAVLTLHGIFFSCFCNSSPAVYVPKHRANYPALRFSPLFINNILGLEVKDNSDSVGGETD